MGATMKNFTGWSSFRLFAHDFVESGLAGDGTIIVFVFVFFLFRFFFVSIVFISFSFFSTIPNNSSKQEKYKKRQCTHWVWANRVYSGGESGNEITEIQGEMKMEESWDTLVKKEGGRRSVLSIIFVQHSNIDAKARRARLQLSQLKWPSCAGTRKRKEF